MAGTAHPVVTIPPGAPRSVDLILVGAPAFDGVGTEVPVEVWNGTKGTVSDVDVSGAATNSSGTVIGSGDSQDIEPQNLPPGTVAFGMVYFSTNVPVGSNLSALSPTYRSGRSTYYLDVETTQANFVAGAYGDATVTGAVANNNAVAVTGPVSTDTFCFSPAGSLLSVSPGFTSGDGGLAPGQTGSFSDALPNNTCPTLLVGSSGFGQP